MLLNTVQILFCSVLKHLCSSKVTSVCGKASHSSVLHRIPHDPDTERYLDSFTRK